MAKKNNGSSFPWLTAIGIGIAGVAVYEIFFAGKSSAPAALPSAPGPTASPAAPAAMPQAPEAKLQDYGPKYQFIRNEIEQLNALRDNGRISDEQYQTSKGYIKAEIDQAFLDRRITVTDSFALESRFTA